MAGIKSCSYYGCTSKKTDKDISFFKLPTDEERRNEWLEIINRTDLIKPGLNPSSYVVCSKHFDKSSLIFTPRLKPDAVPTSFVQELHESSTIDQTTQTEDPSLHRNDQITQTKDLSSQKSLETVKNKVIDPGNHETRNNLSLPTSLKTVKNEAIEAEYVETVRQRPRSKESQSPEVTSANTEINIEINKTLDEPQLKRIKHEINNDGL